MALSSLEDVLTHEFLESVCNFWFSHIKSSDKIIAPDVEEATPWFMQQDAYDRACISNFGAQLEYIKSVEASGTKILSAGKPVTPLHWMSLIILLDQLPRNCFRGAEIGVAYSFFDGLALEIALQAIELGIPEHAQMRFRLAYRFWFYMPLEHSESMEMQEMVTKEHTKMFLDYQMLRDGTEEHENSDVVYCRSVLLRRRKNVENFRDTMGSIVARHVEILRRFGRYPERNEALGRQSTEEELVYLETRK